MKLVLRFSWLWMLVCLVGCSDPTAPFIDEKTKPRTHGVLGEVDDWGYLTNYYGDFDAYLESAYSSSSHFDSALVTSTQQISAAGFYNQLGYLFLPSEMKVFANDSVLQDRYGRLESTRPLDFPGKLVWRLQAGDGFDADTFSMKLPGKVRILSPFPRSKTAIDFASIDSVIFDAPGADSVWISYGLLELPLDSTAFPIYNHVEFKTSNIGSAPLALPNVPHLNLRGSLQITVAVVQTDSIMSKGRHFAIRSAATDDVFIPVLVK